MKAGFYRPDRIGCRSAWVASGPSELYHSKGRFRVRIQPVDATPALNRSAGFRTPESCKVAL